MPKVAPPVSPRGFLTLLAYFWNEEEGIGRLIRDVDWSAVMPLQVYAVVMGRLPESSTVAVRGAGYSAPGHVHDAVLSPEFQQDIIRRVLLAFPEKRRLLFVHIPKCAGTDLILNLDEIYPSLHANLARPEWTLPDQFVRELVQVLRQSVIADSIFVSGHIYLRWYLENSLYRFGDRLFAVVRDPLEAAVSQANYVLKRFAEGPKLLEPDTREWADMLGIDVFDRQTSPDKLRDLASRILCDPRIVSPNNLCQFLGEGTTASALELLARANVELTDTARYSRWLEETWGIRSTTRANQSISVIRITDLDRAQQARLVDTCAEDIRLFEVIRARLDRTEDCRIFGTDLVA